MIARGTTETRRTLRPQVEEKAKLVCQPDGSYGPITDREVAVRWPELTSLDLAGGDLGGAAALCPFQVPAWQSYCGCLCSPCAELLSKSARCAGVVQPALLADAPTAC